MQDILAELIICWKLLEAARHGQTWAVFSKSRVSAMPPLMNQSDSVIGNTKYERESNGLRQKRESLLSSSFVRGSSWEFFFSLLIWR